MRKLSRLLAMTMFVIWADCGIAAHSSAPQTSVSPSAASVSSPAAPPPAVAPITPPVAPGNSPSPELQAITQISSATIKSAQDSVDQVKWVFSIASVVVTVLLAVLAFLGFQNIRNVARSVRDEARRRVDVEIAELKKLISEATQMAVRTPAALRMVSLAEMWIDKDNEDGKRAYYQRAIVAIRDVRGAAVALKDSATEAWAYSFEAYCLSILKEYSQAIEAQLIALQQSTEDDPLDHYNLACYYALVGQEAAAIAQLKLAIQGGEERFKTYARNDPDFVSIRGSQSMIDLIGPVGPINVLETREKTAPLMPGGQQK